MRSIALTFLLVLTACGYSSGQVAGGDGRTLAVKVFQNQTLRRDLERDLTRVVQEEFRTRSSWRLTDEDHAELVLNGRITDLSEMVLSERSKGRIRESSVSITVLVSVTNRRTGEKVVDEVRIVERSSFVPSKGGSIRTAEIDAMRALAEKIVYQMSIPW